jgi:hypothetical protein
MFVAVGHGGYYLVPSWRPSVHHRHYHQNSPWCNQWAGRQRSCRTAQVPQTYYRVQMKTRNLGHIHVCRILISFMQAIIFDSLYFTIRRQSVAIIQDKLISSKLRVAKEAMLCTNAALPPRRFAHSPQGNGDRGKSNYQQWS